MRARVFCRECNKPCHGGAISLVEDQRWVPEGWHQFDLSMLTCPGIEDIQTFARRADADPNSTEVLDAIADHRDSWRVEIAELGGDQ